MDANKIGSFIQSRRKELGLTQSQLGEKLGVTDKAISRWERGVGFPDISLLEPLADALCVTVVELMRGERTEQITMEEAKEMIVQTIDLAAEQQRTKTRNRMLWFVAMPLLFVAYLILSTAIKQYIREPAWLGILCDMLVILGLIYGSRAIRYIARCEYLIPPKPRKPLAERLALDLTVIGIFTFLLSFLLNTDGLRHLYVPVALGGLLLSFTCPLYYAWRVCKENPKEE